MRAAERVVYFQPRIGGIREPAPSILFQAASQKAADG